MRRGTDRTALADPALDWLLLGAVMLPLLLVALGAGLSWRQAWREAQIEVTRAADTAAEYASRVLERDALLAARVDDLLHGVPDVAIRAREREFHDALERLLAGHPGLSSFVLDREGGALLAANLYPVPRNQNFADREFHVALRQPDAPEVHVSRVFRGRVDGAVYFAVSRRRSETGNGRPPGSFDGLVNVSVYPRDLAPMLRRLLGAPGDLLALVRRDGEVLARSEGLDEPLPPLPREGPLAAAMAQGAPQAEARGPSALAEGWRLTAARRAGDWPVYAVLARPRAAVVGRWLELVAWQLPVGLAAVALLGGLARHVRRQERWLRDANEVLERRVAERTRELEARTAQLATSEAEFRAIFENSIVGKSQADALTLRFVRVNQAFCEIVGYEEEELVGRMTVLDVTHPEDRAADETGYRAAVADRRPYQVEKRYLRKDGSVRWVIAASVLLPAAPGRPTRSVAVVQDITDRKLAEERQALLAREVDHRAKNALAVVQAALRLTPKDDALAFARAVEGRVGALARAQTLLAEGRWSGAPLHALAKAELSGFLAAEADRGDANLPTARLVGPPVLVTAEAAQPLSMALHELATNATKHGALSVPGGLVTVSWVVDAQQRSLQLDWVEAGGPPVGGPPARRGFGSRVLEATLHQLGGTIALDWRAEGLRCRMQVPLGRVAARAPGAPAG